MKIDFFKEFDNKFKKTKEANNLETVLQNLSKQVHDRYNKFGIDSYVISSSSSDSKFREMSFVLSTTSGTSYTYHLMRIKLPIDGEFPFRVTAFLNPPTEEFTFENTDYSDFIDWVVNDVIGNVRMRIVTEHLRQMNNTISSWEEEGEID